MKFLQLVILVSVCIGVSMQEDEEGEGYRRKNKNVQDFVGAMFGGKNYRDSDRNGYVEGGKYANRYDFDYVKKVECRHDDDCGVGEICSDGYCNPDCGQCAEYDFTISRCRNLCTRKARCDRNYCICPTCMAMNGYDSFWDCTPPRFLRGICGVRGSGYNGGKRNAGYKGCQGYDCP